MDTDYYSSAEEKIMDLAGLIAWRAMLPKACRVVATNGCFDILHPGHIYLLEQARTEGEFVVVGVNSDASVRQLKGPTRPVNSQHDRAAVIAALEAVDIVYIFDDLRATSFLQHARPHVWVKGGDYTMETLDAGEREAALGMNCVIRLVRPVPNVSTTAILKKAAT